jgi:hypothetical protein
MTEERCGKSKSAGTILCATRNEWLTGFLVSVALSLFFVLPATDTPYVLFAWLITTYGLAAYRIRITDRQTWREAIESDQFARSAALTSTTSRRREMYFYLGCELLVLIIILLF